MGMLTKGFPYLFKENLPLEITHIVHQSYIDVDETGTEAAAATAVVIGQTTMAPPKPQIIKINRPFIYLIREKHTNAILFVGQMIHPQ
jgi:serpin B